MKTSSKFLTLALAVFATQVNAQIKVVAPSGKVKIGIEPTGDIGQEQDPMNVLSMHIFGPNGDYRAGSKLAFGDFGEYSRHGWNVFVGEYSDNDADQLWLHGKNGIYMTSNGTASNVVAYYDPVTSGNVFHFNSDVYGYSFMLASDARFKTNVQPLGNALDQLKKLQGVSYSLLPHVLNNANRSTENKSEVTAASTTMTEKDRKSIAQNKKIQDEMNKPGPKRLGLIAQEVQKVFPELVKQDSSNYLFVDYIGLIPVLIEGVKEQETLIDAQNAKIKELESQINSIESKVTGLASLTAPGANDATNTSITASFLYQNTPNPFSSTTLINYFLASSTKASSINVFDMQGNMIKTFALSGVGKGSISINGSELKPGMYIYNLITDGKEADVKRMTLVK